jgi:hypothetical protein
MIKVRRLVYKAGLCGAVALAFLIGVSQRNEAVMPQVQQPIATSPPAPSLEEFQAIAEEGYIYGLPIVMNYGVLYDYIIDKNSGQWKAPFNTISNERRVFTYQDTAIVTPNSDTPYSMLWLDLRAEPQVISVPAVKDRYYSVQLTDGNTFNYGYIGSRATGTEAGRYLVVGPRWKGETPAGIQKVFRSTTDFSLLIFRTQLLNPDDMGNVIKVQSGYQNQPLSAFLKQPAPAAAPAINWPIINKDLAKTNFFDYLSFALQFAPPVPEEQAIRAKLARIGIRPGQPFNLKALPPAAQEAIAQGMAAGAKKVDARVATIGKNINGWQVGSAFGDRAFYNGDWLLRAAAAQAGIFGNDAAEAMYPMAKVLANGAPLDGSKHK